MSEAIVFDKAKLEALRVAYLAAVEAKEEIFTFEGHELLTAYAKYLIEYLAGKFFIGGKVKGPWWEMPR